jgi:hypothetical protein
MDITEYVNSVLTGNTNILGIAFNRGYELLNTPCLNMLGFLLITLKHFMNHILKQNMIIILLMIEITLY